MMLLIIPTLLLANASGTHNIINNTRPSFMQQRFIHHDLCQELVVFAWRNGLMTPDATNPTMICLQVNLIFDKPWNSS